MTIKINYKNNSPKKASNNAVLFVDENFNLKPLTKYISSSEFSYINDLLKTSDLNKKLFVLYLLNSYDFNFNP